MTTLVYVLIALGVFGTLTVEQAIGYGETAIAEAARPALGEAGFVMMAVAALLATASTVNASLYASGGLTATLAEVGQFPPFFGRGSRLGNHAGVLITAAIVLVVSNVVDLGAIASVGSACSLIVFMLVGGRWLPSTRRDRLAAGRDRLYRDRRDGDRARLLRDRHGPERPSDVRSDRSDRLAVRCAGCRLEARPAGHTGVCRAFLLPLSRP